MLSSFSVFKQKIKLEILTIFFYKEIVQVNRTATWIYCESGQIRSYFWSLFSGHHLSSPISYFKLYNDF